MDRIIKLKSGQNNIHDFTWAEISKIPMIKSFVEDNNFKIYE